MIVIRDVRGLSKEVDTLIKNKKSIGFVPTMGALHEGHLALVKAALKENDVVICSIFVNPKQFDNPEDFLHYPSTEKEDLNLLEATGCHIAFLPTVDEIYPTDFKMKEYDFNGLDSVMEGVYRKGHFQGMANVVKRLLDLVKADMAYFGEKDFQQLAIVKKLVEIEQIKTKIIGHPIVREENGLAMSSRNKRLSGDSKEKSAILYKALNMAKDDLIHSNPEKTKEKIEEFLAKNRVDLEYFLFCNEHDLSPIHEYNEDTKARAFIAAYFDKIRLIDNIQMY